MTAALLNNQSWDMPKKALGEIVFWRRQGDPLDDPLPAVVTAISGRSLSLNIFDPNCQYMLTRDTVRYAEDPDVREDDRHANGTWEETSLDIRMKNMEKAIRDLTAAVMKKGDKQ